MLFTKKEAEAKHYQLWYWFFAFEIPLFTYLLCATTSQREFLLCVTLIASVMVFLIDLAADITYNTPEYDFERVSRGVPNLKTWDDLWQRSINNSSFLKNLSRHYTLLNTRNRHFPLGPAYLDLDGRLQWAKQSSSDIHRELNEWKKRIEKRKSKLATTNFTSSPKFTLAGEIQKLFDDWETLALNEKKSVEKVENWIEIVESHPTFERDLSIWQSSSYSCEHGHVGSDSDSGYDSGPD
jgi:hypothetical protein